MNAVLNVMPLLTYTIELCHVNLFAMTIVYHIKILYADQYHYYDCLRYFWYILCII